ncbi:MAG: hypothetical protein ACRDTC_15780 [Pseudonocardiaceae bacterium]
MTIRLRRYPAEPMFLLHWHDPTKVAGDGGTYGVIPAGEFEPSSVALWDRHNDFELWRNIVREYAEELLGEPEHDGIRSQPIDYERWPLFQRLQAARADGSVGVFLLGFNVSALTLFTNILTVAVLGDDVFTDMIRLDGAVQRGRRDRRRRWWHSCRGRPVHRGGGAPDAGDRANDRLGRGLPRLAWKHRAALGL